MGWGWDVHGHGYKMLSLILLYNTVFLIGICKKSTVNQVFYIECKNCKELIGHDDKNLTLTFRSDCILKDYYCFKCSLLTNLTYLNNLII